MEPKFEVQLKIRKPVDEVFEGVVNPKKLSGYFTKTASGPLVAGHDGDVVVRRVPRGVPGQGPRGREERAHRPRVGVDGGRLRHHGSR